MKWNRKWKMKWKRWLYRDCIGVSQSRGPSGTSTLVGYEGIKEMALKIGCEGYFQMETSTQEQTGTESLRRQWAAICQCEGGIPLPIIWWPRGSSRTPRVAAQHPTKKHRPSIHGLGLSKNYVPVPFRCCASCATLRMYSGGTGEKLFRAMSPAICSGSDKECKHLQLRGDEHGSAPQYTV